MHENHDSMRSLRRSHSSHGVPTWAMNSGTNTLSNTTSHEPVPRIAIVSHVSTNERPGASRPMANSSSPLPSVTPAVP